MKTAFVLLFVAAMLLVGPVDSAKDRRNKRKRNHLSQVITLAPSPSPTNRVPSQGQDQVLAHLDTVLESVRARGLPVSSEHERIARGLIARANIEGNTFGPEQGIENVVDNLANIIERNVLGDEEDDEDEGSEYRKCLVVLFLYVYALVF